MVADDRLVRWGIRVWVTIGAVLLVGGLWWLLRAPLGLVLPPAVIAILLVYVLNPAVEALSRRGIPRPIGTLVAYLAGAVVVWGVAVLAGPVLLGQAGELIDALPGVLAAAQDGANDVLARIGVPASSRIDLQPEALTQQLRDFLSTNQDQALGLLRGAGSVVSWVVHLAIAVTLGPILAFYALSDLPRLAAGARRLLPPDRRPEAVDVTSRVGRIVGSYFRGQLLVALFVGSATAIGLAIIGLPFWAVVGITTGVFNLVPLVGPTSGAVFGVLIALTVGDGLQQALLVLLVMVAVQQVDNHVLTPVVVGRSVAVHPITVILALVVAGSLGGIPLMFVAIPTVAVLKLVALHVVVTRVPSMAHIATESDDDVPTRRATLASMALELRRAFERRLADVAASQRGRSPVTGETASALDEPDDEPDGEGDRGGVDGDLGAAPRASTAPPR